MLDFVRLLAAYGIVWLHTPHTVEFSYLSLLGRFAVPFFTATAVFLAWEGLARNGQRTLRQYAWSRFLRIYVPFLAWSLIYLAFKFAKARLLPDQPNDFPGIDFLWLGSFYHLWFMPFILLATLATFCLGRLVRGRPIWEELTFVGCLLVGWQICWLPQAYTLQTVSFGTLVIDTLPAAFWGVALAIAYSHNHGRFLRRPVIGALALVIMLAFMTGIFLFGRNRLAENFAGFALLIFALADWRVPWIARIAKFGALAYGIYLSHLLFIKVLEALETKLGISESLASVCVVFVIAAACSTALAWALCKHRYTRWLVQ
jgi:peptidoglycan/LPS O-acetylase OafA/YrhL